MTTPDPTTGRPAATRRPRVGALLCACLGGGLLAAAALPAFAMQPAPPASAAAPVAAPAAGLPVAPATAAIAPAGHAAPTTVVSAGHAAPVNLASHAAPAAHAADDTIVVMGKPMPMSDRALLLAGDINRLMARPSTTSAARSGGYADADEQAEDADTGSRIQRVLQRALTLLGTPYRWGGTTTAGFDCSGLVGYVFRTTLGIELPRVSRDMARSGEEVDRADLVPGDLVFFGRRGRVDHVGIYLGEGRFVHAPRTGRDVTVSKLDGYWGRKFLEARRVAGI